MVPMGLSLKGRPSLQPTNAEEVYRHESKVKRRFSSWGLPSFSHDKATKPKKRGHERPGGLKNQIGPVKTPVETTHTTHDLAETFHTHVIHGSLKTDVEGSDADDPEAFYKLAVYLYGTTNMLTTITATTTTTTNDEPKQIASSKSK